MAMNETARAKVELDGQQADNQLKELQAKARELRKELKEMRLAKDPGYAAKKREFYALDKSIKDARKSTFDLNRVMKDLSGASMKDLTRAQRQLNAELRGMNRSTAEGKKAFLEKSQQLKRVQTELQKTTTQMRGFNQQQTLMQRISGGFNRYFGIITAASASIFGIIMQFRKLVDLFNEYEKSLMNLSALTGLTGDSLEWLSSKAKEMSTGVVQGNIRLTSSAKDILDAYTVVGSKMPELLSDQEALNAVTREAMILAKAGNIELATSVDALTNTMNQFRAPASEAGNIINIIGAGSKLGAANIEFIGKSIVKFGAAANALNIDVVCCPH